MVMNMKRAKSMGIVISICFLIIHLFIINVFGRYGVTPMVCFNIFSVIFYCFMCVAAYKEWMQIFAVATYLEVVIHMSLAVWFTGWDSGFQVTMLGMNVIGLYSEYVGRTLKLKYVPMLPFGIVGMLLYLGAYVKVSIYGAPYSLPAEMCFWLNIIWGAVTFIITLIVLQIFVSIVSTSEKKLEHQMSHDKLTGLPNRYFMSEYIEGIQKTEGLKDYWIAIADIDDFKIINDTYGHNCGDYVLETLANIFSGRNILCCRWGGEEFIFISQIKENPDEAYNFLEELRKEIENYTFRFNGIQFHVTTTFGMSTFQTGHGTDAWISAADAKLYEGKQNGKNQVVR